MQLRLPQVFINDEANKHTDTLLRSHGDDIHTTKHKGHTRAAFQNTNGIERGEQPAQEIIEVIREYSIDVFGAAETTCKWTEEFKHRVTAYIQRNLGN